MAENKSIILYISTEYYLYGNYVGPELFQIIYMNTSPLTQKFIELINGGYSGIYLPLDVICEDVNYTKTVAARISLSKIKYVVIDDIGDVEFVIKTFGVNFCNYDFIYNIFNHDDVYKMYDPEMLHIFASEIFKPYDLINFSPTCDFFIFCFYSNKKANISMFDIERIKFESECKMKRFLNIKYAYYKNKMFAKSIYNSIFMPRIGYQDMQYFIIENQEHVKNLKKIFKKYSIVINTDKIIEDIQYTSSDDEL